MPDLAIVQKPTAEIEKVNDPYIPRSWEQAIQIGEFLAKSTITVPKAFQGKAADIVAVMMRGHEFGLSPMQALSMFDVIQGKVTITAQSQIAICVSKRNICLYFTLVESTDQQATFKTKRAGTDSEVSLTFTLDEARKMDLAGKDNWKKQAKVMMRWRAATALARIVYPDLIQGIYSAEELFPDEPVADEAVRAELARDITPPKVTVAPAEKPKKGVEGAKAQMAEQWERVYRERIAQASQSELTTIANELVPRKLPADHALKALWLKRTQDLEAMAAARDTPRPATPVPQPVEEQPKPEPGADFSEEELAAMKADLDHGESAQVEPSA